MRIVSERLAIRTFERGDVTDAYLSWLNDRELMRFSRQRLLAHTRESCEEYRRSFEGSPNFFWNVERQADGLQVGTLTAYVDPGNDVANVGILIGLPGEGYGSEAFGAALAYLFEFLAVPKVTAGTLRTNQAMIGVARRHGMMLKWIVGDGDTYVYDILRSEWMALAQRTRIVVEPDP